MSYRHQTIAMRIYIYIMKAWTDARTPDNERTRQGTRDLACAGTQCEEYLKILIIKNLRATQLTTKTHGTTRARPGRGPKARSASVCIP